jgi:hypothetical protein
MKPAKRTSNISRRSNLGLSCYDESIDYLQIREEITNFLPVLHKIKTLSIYGTTPGNNKPRCFCEIHANIPLEELIFKAKQALFTFRYTGVYFQNIDVQAEYLTFDDLWDWTSPTYTGWNT